MDSRSREIRKASILAIFGNAILALSKITGGLVSGSLAVVGDGVDSCMDIVTSSIPYFATKIIDKPADQRHPYGHYRAETIATKVLSLIIFFVGFQLLYSNALEIFKSGVDAPPTSLAIIVTVVSIAGKLLLSTHQFRVAKKTNSSMLHANATNMRNDIVTSSSVLLGLVLSTILNLPVIDQITAIIISVFIMKSAFSMFMETNNELMDGVDDVSIYDEICDVVESIKGVHHPHRIRIRKLSVQYVIDLDIEVDGDMTVSDAHELTRNVEEKIKDRIANVYDVIVHTEPLGNCEHNECFGYSRA